MRQSPLAKAAAAQLPASRASREADLQSARRFAVQAISQAQLAGGTPEDLFRRTRQQPLSGGIREPQSLIMVESEDRHFDGGDHLTQQGRRFERSQALFAQRRAQLV